MCSLFNNFGDAFIHFHILLPPHFKKRILTVNTELNDYINSKSQYIFRVLIKITKKLGKMEWFKMNNPDWWRKKGRRKKSLQNFSNGINLKEKQLKYCILAMYWASILSTCKFMYTWIFFTTVHFDKKRNIFIGTFILVL